MHCEGEARENIYQQTKSTWLFTYTPLIQCHACDQEMLVNVAPINDGYE